MKKQLGKCLKLHSENRKIESNSIDNYNYYINKCFNYLFGTENYNKKINLLYIKNLIWIIKMQFYR